MQEQQTGKKRFAHRQRQRTARARGNGRALRLSVIALIAAFVLYGWIGGLFRTWAASMQNAWTRERGKIVLPATDMPEATMALTVDVRERELVTETALLFAQSEPRVLIYHTHASEAYLKTEDEPYEESGSWRTLDNEKNVVAIGKRLQTVLRETYGIEALHDTGNYEAPKLATAYSRSLTAMEAYRAEYPSLTLYVDIHRDAYGKNEENTPKDTVTIAEAEVARIMLVVGTGEGATGSGFPELPDYQSNYQLAERVTARLREKDERLARDIRVKTGRYNQHVSNRCMLVEVGHTANTFTQAMNAIPYLAEAIAAEMKSVPGPGTLVTSEIWTP